MIAQPPQLDQTALKSNSTILISVLKNGHEPVKSALRKNFKSQI